MAPRKAAPQAATKGPGHHGGHKSATEARRAFEHLGRVQALAALTPADDDSLCVLRQRADAAYQAQQFKNSADLLRAAEHLSFALIERGFSGAISRELGESVRREFEHLISRSEEHASDGAIPADVLAVLARVSQEGLAALQEGSCCAALEYARCAEALSHVHAHGERLPGTGAMQRALRN